MVQRGAATFDLISTASFVFLGPQLDPDECRIAFNSRSDPLGTTPGRLLRTSNWRPFGPGTGTMSAAFIREHICFGASMGLLIYVLLIAGGIAAADRLAWPAGGSGGTAAAASSSSNDGRGASTVGVSDGNVDAESEVSRKLPPASNTMVLEVDPPFIHQPRDAFQGSHENRLGVAEPDFARGGAGAGVHAAVEVDGAIASSRNRAAAIDAAGAIAHHQDNTGGRKLGLDTGVKAQQSIVKGAAVQQLLYVDFEPPSWVNGSAIGAQTGSSASKRQLEPICAGCCPTATAVAAPVALIPTIDVPHVCCRLDSEHAACQQQQLHGVLWWQLRV